MLTWRALEVRDISVGDFSMLLSSALTLGNNLRFFSNTIADLIEQGLFLENYYAFTSIVKDMRTKHGSKDIPKKFEKLEAKNLQFRYNEKQELIFQDISVKINKGQKVALVGANGVGKSTFVNIILKFYEPQEGKVQYNHYDIREFESEDYRHLFSLVFQETNVYPFTIAENILLRSPETKEDIELVWDSLERVELDQKIRELPNGVDTMVTKTFDNSGVVFSGGECQKLTLARAIAQNTQFFIMDEPTSALDPKMELQLNQMLSGILNDKALLLISHRLSTIIGVDYIYLIRDGRVEEEGTHQELMAKNGRYARIYRLQSELYTFE